jgi:hypothetical protein
MDHNPGFLTFLTMTGNAVLVQVWQDLLVQSIFTSFFEGRLGFSELLLLLLLRSQ